MSTTTIVATRIRSGASACQSKTGLLCETLAAATVAAVITQSPIT